jgi:hypothetical protein
MFSFSVPALPRVPGPGAVSGPGGVPGPAAPGPGPHLRGVGRDLVRLHGGRRHGRGRGHRPGHPAPSAAPLQRGWPPPGMY